MPKRRKRKCTEPRCCWHQGSKGRTSEGLGGWGRLPVPSNKRCLEDAVPGVSRKNWLPRGIADHPCPEPMVSCAPRRPLQLGQRRPSPTMRADLLLTGPPPTFRFSCLAADLFVRSKCERSSGDKVVEEALFRRGIFKLDVTPLRVTAG
jgi:hypothetical protein